MAGPRRQNSYFDQGVQTGGQDFIDHKTVQDLQRDAKKRIFKDLAYGNVSFEKYGCYFMDVRFMEQLIIAADEELRNHNIYCNALSLLDFTYPGEQYVIALKTKEARLVSAYAILQNSLRAVRDSGYNISALTCLASALGPYKYDLSNL